MEVEKMDRTQSEIDEDRAKTAKDIVDGQAVACPDMTVEDWKRFARSWIVTASQLAANEEYYRAELNKPITSEVHEIVAICKTARAIGDATVKRYDMAPRGVDRMLIVAIVDSNRRLAEAVEKLALSSGSSGR
jgi:hypothetical protein